MLSGLVLPVHLHLLVQALAIGIVGSKLPRMCGCLPQGSFDALYGRIARLHRRVGFSLLSDWLPIDPTVATGGSCLPAMAAFTLAKILIATTLLSIALEAGLRAHFLVTRQAVKFELWLLGAEFTVISTVVLSLWSIVWEASVVAARWYEMGSFPSLLEVAAVGTSLAVQLFMRYWLFTVLTVLVCKRVLLLYWRQQHRELLLHEQRRQQQEALLTAAQQQPAGPCTSRDLVN